MRMKKMLFVQYEKCREDYKGKKSVLLLAEKCNLFRRKMFIRD